MPEIISCPNCQRRLQAPEEVLGRDVQCPTCGIIATVLGIIGFILVCLSYLPGNRGSLGRQW
ncbi:MAG: hypothetical protein IT429_14325 [Gemmataceae bacterium]|nr:hypothetical protein [Gemmataceae bacterium]